MLSVSACLVVRDEQKFLGGCLESLKGHVDEIVLVDTGSVDKTVAIAESFGCRIAHQPWQNDFSTPRNLGLEMARSNWILYIDADERLSMDDGCDMRLLIPEQGAAALEVKFYPRPDTTAYAEQRLFLRDPRIRFQGSLHETMRPGIQRVCTEDGLEVVQQFRISLLHLGYDGDQSHKHARNLPMLERAVAEDPTRVYLRFHLGVTLEGMGRFDEAESVLRAGVTLAERPDVPVHSRAEGSLCATTLSQILVNRGAAAEALSAAERGEALYRGNIALLRTKARALLALRREEEALASLEALSVHGPETFFDPLIAYPREIFEVELPALLGAAHFRLGAFGRAAEFYEQAAAASGNAKEFAVKAELARARARGARLSFGG